MKDATQLHIRPARPEEAGLFYTPHPEEDKRLGKGSVTMAHPEGLTLSEVLRQKKEHDKTSCRRRVNVLYSDLCVCLQGGKSCSIPTKKCL